MCWSLRETFPALSSAHSPSEQLQVANFANSMACRSFNSLNSWRSPALSAFLENGSWIPLLWPHLRAKVAQNAKHQRNSSIDGYIMLYNINPGKNMLNHFKTSASAINTWFSHTPLQEAHAEAQEKDLSGSMIYDDSWLHSLHSLHCLHCLRLHANQDPSKKR